MRFEVTRTSYFGTDKKPCKGAWKGKGLDYVVWFIEFNTLGELMAFTEEHGECVITSEPSIEIYDDYRE